MRKCLKYGFMIGIAGVVMSSIIGSYFALSDISVKRRKDRNTHETAKKSRNRPYLILHVGPHKTGTSSIQHFCNRATRGGFLEKDNYIFVYRTEIIRNFRKCFMTKDLCEREQIEHLESFLQRLMGYHLAGTNVILSDEEFSLAITSKTEWVKFETFLKTYFKVKIVVAYRRFYDWLPSWYNEEYKNKKKQKHFQEWPDQGGQIIPTFDEYFNLYLSHPYHNGELVHPAMNFMGKDKENFQVALMNFHHDDIIIHFFCNVIPNAKKTCAEATSMEHSRRRETEVKHYIILADTAHQQNIISKTAPKNDILKKLKIRQEVHLGLSPNDFPLKCISPQQEILLKNLSLSFEKEMFPMDYELMKADHNAGFEMASAAKQFCSIDAEAVLENKKWHKFLESL